jgi:ABC-type anion transport system duplicated permease subunit
MVKKKNRRSAQSVPRKAAQTLVDVQWVVVVLLIGLMFGGFIGYYIGAAVSSGGGGTAIADAYGRSPSHPHFNHSHP